MEFDIVGRLRDGKYVPFTPHRELHLGERLYGIVLTFVKEPSSADIEVCIFGGPPAAEILLGMIRCQTESKARWEYRFPLSLTGYTRWTWRVEEPYMASIASVAPLLPKES